MFARRRFCDRRVKFYAHAGNRPDRFILVQREAWVAIAGIRVKYARQFACHRSRCGTPVLDLIALEGKILET